jgi:MFS superfamily sulfate permease-like transporter
VSFDDAQHPPGELSLIGERRTADPSVAPRSAVVLVSGLVLALVGVAVMALAWTSSAARAAIDPGGVDTGRVPLIFGCLLALAGTVMLVVGLWRLAVSVDYLAQREKDREHAA